MNTWWYIYIPQFYINFPADEHVMIFTYRNFISIFLLMNTRWYIHTATLHQLFLQVNTWCYIHTVTLYWFSCWWTRDDIYIPQLYINFPSDEHLMIDTYRNFLSTLLQMNTGWYIDTVTLYELSCTGTSDNIYIPQLYMNFPWDEQVVIYTYWKFFSTSLQMNMCCFIHAGTLYHFLFIEHVMIDFFPQLDINFPVDKDVIINIYIMQLDINFLVHTETVRITTFCYRKFHSTIKFVVYYVETRLPFLRIFSRMRSFIASHIPYWRSRAEIGFDRSRLPLCRHEIWVRDYCRWTRDDIYIPQLYIIFHVDKHLMIYTCCNFVTTVPSMNTWWHIHGATLF